MTGRASGYCGGYPVPGFMNPIPGFERRWRRGRGRGFGRGYGRGFRWWSANPLYPYPPYIYPSPMYPPTPSQSPGNELAALEDYKKEIEEEKASIEQEINDLETRMKELKTKAEQGRSEQPGQ
jgi:hypothetical protein